MPVTVVYCCNDWIINLHADVGMGMVVMEGNGNGGIPKGIGACSRNWIANEWERGMTQMVLFTRDLDNFWAVNLGA